MRDALSSIFQKERFLGWLGVIGLIEALVVFFVLVARGSYVAPEGELYKAVEAYLALGTFTMTAAAILPVAQLPRWLRAVWRALFSFCVLYSYTFEITQHARGIDPRLSEFWNPIENRLSMVYLLTSQLYVVLFLSLLGSLFRPKVYAARPEMVVSLRYGLLSVFWGFLAGYWMLSEYQGRRVGEGGDWVLIHAYGFHGVQAIPVIAWLLERTQLSKAQRLAWLHTAGLSWLLGGVMLSRHVGFGLSLSAYSPALLAAVCALLVWSFAGLVALLGVSSQAAEAPGALTSVGLWARLRSPFLRGPAKHN